MGRSSSLPTACHVTGGRSNSGLPIAKARAGSVNEAAATAPAPCAVSVMKRRRVTVSPSKAPGINRSAVYLDLGSLRGEGTARRTISTGTGSQTSAGALPRGPADGAGARLPGGARCSGIALGVGLRGARDHAGQDVDRLEVAELGQAGHAERVQAVAGEQREVGIAGPQDAALAVVLEVALVDRLDELLVAGAGQLAQPRVLCGIGHGVGQQTTVGTDSGGERLERGAHAISPNAAAAASTVRSTCSEVWARLGNQASNCDGGG